MRILLIEDDERLGPLVVRLLSAERHTVQLAATGADGVAFWESQEWDLVILDVMLPALGGFDVVKARLALSGPEIQHGIIHGADAVKVSGMKVCLKGNVVVTVLGKEQRPKPGRVFKSFRELADAAE